MPGISISSLVEAGVVKIASGGPAEKAEAQTPSKSGKEAKKLTALRTNLFAGHPGKSATAPPVDSDLPKTRMRMQFNVLDIQPYEFNPRKAENPDYEDIYQSIRSSGLRNTFNITKRPGDSHFITHDGGNTRLSILKRLLEEEGEKWQYVFADYVPWTSESAVLCGHLIENTTRGDMAFWDTAASILLLREEIGKELGRKVSYREFRELLGSKGLHLSNRRKSLDLMLFSALNLSGLPEKVRYAIDERSIASLHSTLENSWTGSAGLEECLRQACAEYAIEAYDLNHLCQLTLDIGQRLGFVIPADVIAESGHNDSIPSVAMSGAEFFAPPAAVGEGARNAEEVSEASVPAVDDVGVSVAQSAPDPAKLTFIDQDVIPAKQVLPSGPQARMAEMIGIVSDIYPGLLRPRSGTLAGFEVCDPCPAGKEPVWKLLRTAQALINNDELTFSPLDFAEYMRWAVTQPLKSVDEVHWLLSAIVDYWPVRSPYE